MGLVPNPKVIRINTKSSKFYECIISYHTQRVVCWAIKNWLLDCPTKMGGPSLALHRPFLGLGQHAPCTHPILDPIFSQSLRGGKRQSQKFMLQKLRE